jgi:hypothetical protein
MAANRSNREVEDIDEAFLLQSIKDRDDPKPVKQTPPLPAPDAGETREAPEPVPEKPKEGKEPGRRKRNSSNADYGNLFLQRNEFKARQCVYISQRIHTTISEIVRVISDRDITVGGYIDSILMEHLETHKEEITELYNRELEKKNGKNLMEF